MSQNQHILQSPIWKQFQEKLGRQTYWLNGPNGDWCVLMHGRGGFKYLYCPHGPTIDSHTDLPESLGLLKKLGQKLAVDFVRVEPWGAKVSELDMQRMGLFKHREVQPELTQVVELTHSIQELRQGLATGHRSRINGAERKRITVQVEQDQLALFLKMIHDTAQRKGFVSHPDSYYQTMIDVLAPAGAAQIWVARSNGDAVASAIEFRSGTTSYYAHAAAFQDLNRKTGAAVILVWEMLQAAKNDGLKEFDLYGVSSSSLPDHPWHGLSEFKRGFGGKELETIGTWLMPIRPLRYRLYLLAKKLI